MKRKDGKFPFFRKTTLQITGIVLILILAVTLLWYGNKNSQQATSAMVAQVRFEGEYRIADGPWLPIVSGRHISASQGDVTLRGNFHIFAPNGEYVDIYTGDMPIALYINHLRLAISVGDNAPDVLDMENPLYGQSSCGESWYAYSYFNEERQSVQIHIYNPHRYGNENAIDQLLSNVSFWSGIDFEKQALSSGDTQRDIGLLLMIVSLVLLGTALFSSLIHIKNNRIIWVLGTVILFAGTYVSYSADGVSFWSESVVSNTTILGCSMMFYMLFLSIALVHLLRSTKKVATITVAVVGGMDALFLVLPMVTDMLFYDTWLYWVLAQGVANCIMLGCIVREICLAGRKDRWMFIGLMLPLISFGVDAVVTRLGFWQGGLVSTYVFILFFIVAMVAVLRIIPQSINALAKAKELETERIMLNAQLTESRMSTMMSQIRPHFIYNTLGSIEQLCELDPDKAGELVHNFAKYLRGNFGELDNPKPIRMSQEMDHVRHYVSIENVRFPDMTFSFEMNSEDFPIPALTIQPIVENAIKHGLMKLQKGGTIRVVSYETDTHYCVSVVDDGVGFDSSLLLDERKHVGLRNIRERLKAMVNGSIEIESTVGVGTKVLIRIPKEGMQ